MSESSLSWAQVLLFIFILKNNNKNNNGRDQVRRRSSVIDGSFFEMTDIFSSDQVI